MSENTSEASVGIAGHWKDIADRDTIEAVKVNFFIVDESDEVLIAMNTRRDVPGISRKMPNDKQVIVLTDNLAKEKRFC